MKETTWLVDEDGHKQREAEPGMAGPMVAMVARLDLNMWNLCGFSNDFQSQFEGSFLYVFQMKQKQFEGSLKERTRGSKCENLVGFVGLCSPH